MAEVLFISEDYIKKYTTLNGSVDPNLLYPAVYLAQDKWVNPYLGDDLYNKLKELVADNDVTGVYKVLLEDYVQRVVLWWAMVEALPSLSYKIDNSTMVQRTSDDASPVSDVVMKDTIDRAKSNAQQYTQRLVEFLCARSEDYPEYSSNIWPNRSPRTDVLNSMNYIISSGNTATSFNPYPQYILNKLPL